MTELRKYFLIRSRSQNTSFAHSGKSQFVRFNSKKKKKKNMTQSRTQRKKQKVVETKEEDEQSEEKKGQKFSSKHKRETRKKIL